jgi:uncharacterized cupin superfamily protein
VEARLERAGEGLEPAGEGWFVLNAREARWVEGEMGAYTRFESKAARFPQMGINLAVLQPGQASCKYHREDAQEDFLVLAGECLLIVEEQERHLRAWDFVHCPPWTEHVFVGAGEGPCAIVAIGARIEGSGIVYPVSELALRHNAGVATETARPDEAYADTAPDVDAPFRPAWLAW